MINKKKSRVGMASFLLALVIFATSSFVNINYAIAGITLPHIEEIIAQKSTFNILEIVPQKDSGTLGYYVEAQEPDADWLSDLADIKTTAERTEYADRKFTALNNAGLINREGTAPLKVEKWDSVGGKTIYYSEMLPWEKEEDEQWETLTLNNAQSVSLTGTFLEQAGAQYKAVYEYKLNHVTSGYIQQVSKVTYGSQTEKMFYYNPVFEPIESGTDVTLLTGKAVYTMSVEGIYLFEGFIGTMDGLDVGKEYFYIEEVGNPFDNFDALNAPYAAMQATFAIASPGYFIREKTGYEYCESGGDYTFKDGVGTETADVKYSFVRYKAGYSNNNWLQKSVFNLEADQLSNLNIRVNTVLASEVSAVDAGSADLIYISSGFLPSKEAQSYSVANDLSADTALSIYSNVAQQCPVIIDYSLVKDIGSGTTSMLNIQKLALLCLQNGLSTAKYNVFSEVEINWGDMATLNSDTDRTFVNGNVYCFYPFSTQSINGVVDAKAMATTNFKTSFAEAVYNNGFALVLTEIQNENFYRQVAEDNIRHEEVVSIANALRYIINYSHRRITDEVSFVRVLEIQPSKVSGTQVLAKATVLSWLGSGTTLTEDNVQITTMTSAEFIGKIENINEEFDLVYIGANTVGMNRGISGETVYNDENMNGLIYSNVGDIFLSDIGMAGLLDRDYTTTSTSKSAIDATSTSKANTFRFSGNDITAAKARDIEDFVKAGYPVVIADKLFNVNNAINTHTVDNSSFMHDAIDSIKGYDNVINATVASSNNGKVIKYLGVSKPTINLTAAPKEYLVDSNGIATSIEKDADGQYYLEYIFNIQNATDATPFTTTYDCGLYLDLNADGRYIEDEKLIDIEVYNNDDASMIMPMENSNGKLVYGLSSGIEYKVRRQMPDKFVGIIPWKLEVIKNNADHIHASVHKYTRIAATADTKQIINVLQIAKKNSSTQLINLEQQLKAGTITNPQLRGKDGRYYKGIYGKLIADLDDFDIVITTLETNELAQLGTSENIYNKLNKYDMLIIGFADTYQDVGQESAMAILKYIESGRSVLFTHDTTSHQNIPNSSYPVVTGAGNTAVTMNTTSQWTQDNDMTVVYPNTNKLDVNVNSTHNNRSIYRYQYLEVGSYKMTGTLTIPSNSKNNHVTVGIVNGIISHSVSKKFATKDNNSESISFSIDFTVEKAGSIEIYLKFAEFDMGKYVLLRNFAITKEGTAYDETTIGSAGSIGYWGYYFNTVIRDAVGLDRYGITSSTIKSIIKGHNGAEDYLTQDQIKGIEDADYSVAFKPRSSGNYTVAETQGYTNYELIRYVKSGQNKYSNTNNNYSNRGTEFVSQVNEGQITTYPYNVNTTNFGGNVSGSLGGSYMMVGDTHEQYYQLNMNSDDIVVWYCLSSGSMDDSNYYYDDTPNDVINAYYIYNKSNVTYSGVGHTADNKHYTGYGSDGKGIYTRFINEAQLFVNTMISSYNSGTQAPKVSIKDSATGKTDLQIKYFTTEYPLGDEGRQEDVLEKDYQGLSESRAVYFKISDPNLDESKTIALSYAYAKDGGEIKAFTTTTLNANGSTAGTIKGGYMYKIYVPDEVLSDLGAEDVSIVQLHVYATTTIGEIILKGSDSLELRKVGLFHLK